jgi:undecaprenyl-diphosphatase
MIPRAPSAAALVFFSLAAAQAVLEWKAEKAMPELVAAIARTVLAADVSLFKLINGHHTAFFDAFFSAMSYLGNGWVIIPVFLVFILWRTPKSRRAHAVIFTAVVFVISGLANPLVKQVVDRPRPAAYFIPPGAGAPPESTRSFEVHIVGDRLVAHSFPSGHANTAFTVAALVVLACGWRLWPSFFVAALVAYSRIYVGAHFPLDTLAGAVMGAGITLVVWRRLEKISPAGKTGRPL